MHALFPHPCSKRTNLLKLYVLTNVNLYPYVSLCKKNKQNISYIVIFFGMKYKKERILHCMSFINYEDVPKKAKRFNSL